MFTSLHYTTLNYTTLHYTTLHYITAYYTILYYSVHHTTLHNTTLHYTTLYNITLHYITLQHSTLSYTTLYTTQHYTTLNYIIHYTNALLKIDIVQHSIKYNSHDRGSWISIDIGTNRRLVPTRFCVLHGDTEQQNAIRNFSIQGRVRESEPWVQLKNFKNNKKLLDECHSTASWGIKRKKSFFDNILHCSRCDWGSVDHVGFRYVSE